MGDSSDSLSVVSQILGRCVVMGFALLLIWSGVMIWASGFVFRPAQWFGLSSHECALVVYGALAVTKILVILFFLIPYVSVRLVLRRRKP